MPVESSSLASRPSLRLRADVPDDEPTAIGSSGLVGAFVAMAVGFVLIGAGNRELGPDEARLGLSAVEPLGAFGQSFGGWRPEIWAGTVLPSRLWQLTSGMWDQAIVRWPAAIAAILIGLVLARSTRAAIGTRAAILATLCWFGGAAMIDRSAGVGLELIAGLGTILALNRLLTRGSGWVAGLCAAWAFLAGGWPPLALIGLASVVLGRRGSTPSIKMAIPVVLAVSGWSAWALATAKAQTWAAALTLPLTQSSAWTLAFGVMALGLPWSPFALLGLSKGIRSAWLPSGRPFVTGWGQVALASLIAGTIIPGLASAARLPALAGLAIVAAAAWESVLSTTIEAGARRWFHLAGLGVVVAWTAVVLIWGGHLALAVGNYRTIATMLIALAIGTATLAIGSAWMGHRRGALASLVLMAIAIKVAHWGYYVPEANYRLSQGPWGRAIGQWVPRGRTVHVLHGWQPDLIFALGRPVRQLVSPLLLPDRPGPSPKLLLLKESEFDHWMEDWPKILKVARFEDEFGGARVLARTEGDYSWKRLARAHADSDE